MTQYQEIQLPKRLFFQSIREEPTDFQVTSFDTETLNGYCRLLADNAGNFVYTTNFLDIYNFLTRKELHKQLKTFYNLDYDVRGIIKYLPVDNQHDLYYQTETTYKGITIRYLPGKVFTVKRKRLNYSYYDIQQFYGGSLQHNATKYLHAGKDNYQVTNLTEKDFLPANTDLVKYCIQDCKLTAELTRLQQKKFADIGISFYKPISKANLAEKYVIKRMKLPVPRKNRFQQLAYYSYKGGRFELLQRGYFDRCYCYDLNSAYPNIIKDLPNPFDTTYYKVEDYEKDAEIAYYDLTLHDLHEPFASPITVTQRGINIFPNTVNHRIILSQPELKYIRKYLKVDYTINEAYALYSYTNDKPFMFMEDLYKLRKEAEKEDPVLAQSIKIIINSVYGKFWQVTKTLKDVTTDLKDYDLMFSTADIFRLYKKQYKAGAFFNPAYAAHITATVRTQLLETCYKYLDTVIGFHTDSIITTKPFIKCKDGLGNWRLDHHGRGIFLGTGLYTIDDGEHVKHKRRGGTTKELNSWFDILDKVKDKSNLIMPLSHVVTLGDIFNFPNMFNIGDLNNFTTINRILSVDNDNKRNWSATPTTFKDLLTDNFSSVPLEV